MSFGGKFDYADEYAKYRPKDDAKFGSYVDKYPDLSAAWKRIESDPDHPDSQYWINRGATSKAAFGRAHAAEDEALSSGTYHGGTDVKPYEGDTRFEKWLDTSPGPGPGPGSPYVGGGGSPGDRNAPMSIVDYNPPSAMSGIPLEYQPWLQPDHIPDNLWNYQAPELTPWKGRGVDWSWAEKPASEYGPQPVVKPTPPPFVFPAEGNQNVNPWAGYENVQEAMDYANEADNIQKTQNALELASQGELDTNAWGNLGSVNPHNW